MRWDAFELFDLGILYLRILSFIDLGVKDIAIQELRPGCTWSSSCEGLRVSLPDPKSLKFLDLGSKVDKDTTNVKSGSNGDGATVEFKSGLVAIARENQKAFDGLALFENCFFTSNPTVTFPVLFLSQAKFRQLTVDNGKISRTKLGNAQVKGIVNSMVEVADDVVNLTNYGDDTEVYVVAEAFTNRFEPVNQAIDELNCLTDYYCVVRGDKFSEAMGPVFSGFFLNKS